MPTAQIELDNGGESIDGVVDLGNREEHFGVRHEAVAVLAFCCMGQPPTLDRHYFVILSSILRGSKMKVGRTTRLRSAPGRSWEIMWPSTVEVGGSQCSDSAAHSYGPGTNHFPDRAP